MAKADRLERMDARRLELEADYRAALLAALQVATSGKWGLFGHNDGDRAARAAVAPTLAHLAEIGNEVDDLRRQLMMEPFELQQQFLAARGPVSAHAPGEPRQAQAWLDRLAGEDGAR
ncbi:hypothetical protein [Sphingobium sp.]|uniref:hypothetical protein n=1 Tax=Sphingobium sp. TaxID=1912891 RepID=UPI0035C7580D